MEVTTLYSWGDVEADNVVASLLKRFVMSFCCLVLLDIMPY